MGQDISVSVKAVVSANRFVSFSQGCSTKRAVIDSGRCLRETVETLLRKFFSKEERVFMDSKSSRDFESHYCYFAEVKHGSSVQRLFQEEESGEDDCPNFGVAPDWFTDIETTVPTQYVRVRFIQKSGEEWYSTYDFYCSGLSDEELLALKHAAVATFYNETNDYTLCLLEDGAITAPSTAYKLIPSYFDEDEKDTAVIPVSAFPVVVQETLGVVFPITLLPIPPAILETLVTVTDHHAAKYWQTYYGQLAFWSKAGVNYYYADNSVSLYLRLHKAELVGFQEARKNEAFHEAYQQWLSDNNLVEAPEWLNKSSNRWLGLGDKKVETFNWRYPA